MLKTLIKKEFLGFFGKMLTVRSKKRTSNGSIVLFIVLFLYLFIVLGFSFGGLCHSLLTTLIEKDAVWFYGAFTAALATLFALLGSVFSSMTQLYDSKDNDLLLSLPIPPSYILIARMLPLLVFNLIFTSIAFIPAIVVYIMLVGISPLSLLFQIFILLLVSALSLAISCLIGRLLAVFLAKVKRKALVSIIFSAVFFAVYAYFMINLDGAIEKLMENVISLTVFFKKYLPTLYWTGFGFSGNVLWFFVTLLINAAVSVGIYFIISKTYIKTITGSKGSVQRKYKTKKLKEKSVFLSLLYKEWKRFSGSAVYLINCSVGVILVLIATVIAAIKAVDLRSALTATEISPLIPAILTGGLLAMLSTDCVSAPSISLEGKSLWILQSLPIKPYDVLLAKLTLHTLVSAPLGVICLITLGIILKIDFLSILFGSILIVSFVFFMGCFGLKRNLKNPDFNWTNEAQPVKQSVNILVTMLLGAALSTVIIGIGVALSSVLPGFLVLLILTCITVLFDLLYNRWFKNQGAKIFKSL